MDGSPEVLAEQVRAKRVAIDNDLELLRVRLQQADPRRIDAGRWARRLLPIVAGAGALVWWLLRRRSVHSLDQLLAHELRDLYATEQDLVPALERMAEQATNPELKRAFEQHRMETESHVERLERVFRAVGERPKRGTADAVRAVEDEAARMLKRRVDPSVRDASLIAAAQRIEHIEISTYGTARAFAQTLGHTYAAQLLQQTLDEERAADEKLTSLAQRFVNRQSAPGANERDVMAGV